MTRRRYDEHSTEFGVWLRQQKELDSKIGYIATNIDYLWTNYRNGLWMLIEEKRYGRQIDFPQTEMFALIDNACKSDPNYKGFHSLVFEKTTPEDGRMYLDRKQISKRELIDFLKFKEYLP